MADPHSEPGLDQKLTTKPDQDLKINHFRSRTLLVSIRLDKFRAEAV
jgi:hypothetical protein